MEFINREPLSTERFLCIHSGIVLTEKTTSYHLTEWATNWLRASTWSIVPSRVFLTDEIKLSMHDVISCVA